MAKKKLKSSFIATFLFFAVFAAFGLFAIMGFIIKPIGFWLLNGHWQESPKEIVLGSIFVLSHGGIGLGGLWWLWSNRNANDNIENTDADQPWLSKTYWASSEISSDLVSWAPIVKKIAWFFMAVALIDLFAIYECIKRQEYEALYGLIIVAIAGLLFYWSKRQESRLAKYGLMSLKMDPYPAAIGGHCGGTIAINNLDAAPNNSSVVVQCLRKYSVKDSDGTSTKTNIVWEDEMVPAWRRTLDGFDLAFCFDIPDDRSLLPAQDREQLPRIVWEVRFSTKTAAGEKITRKYENLPVFQVAGVSSIRDSQAFASQSKATKRQYDDSLDRLMPYKTSGNGYSLHYPWKITLSGVLCSVIGLIFVVTGLLIPDLVFNIVFPFLGGLAFMGGIYSIVNSLTVQISSDFIQSTRFLFGIPIKKQNLPSYAFKEFKFVKSNSTSANNERQYYTIHAIGNDGQKLVVAENIDGEGQAKAAIERLQRFAKV